MKRGRKPGRPEERRVTASVSMPLREYDAFATLAHRKQQSLSSLLRRYILKNFKITP